MNFKTKPVLGFTIVFSLGVQLILVILSFLEIGRFGSLSMAIQLAIQLLIINLINTRKDQLDLYLISMFHLLMIIQLLQSHSSGFDFYALIFYHLSCGILFYFHKEIQERYFKPKI